MRFTRILSRRSNHERQVVAHLRGSHVAGLRDVPDAVSCFDALADQARTNGFDIFEADSPFISAGEIQILSLLAAAQRQEARGLISVDILDFGSLLRCATILRDCGIWLPLPNTLAPGPRRRRPPQRFAASPNAGNASLRARALSFARSREVASTQEFHALGISHQYLSLLCKDGYLQRVRHGWYRAATSPSGTVRAVQTHN